MANDPKSYANGYSAGRKRTEAELVRLNQEYGEIFNAEKRIKRELHNQVFCAALTGLISTSKVWTAAGKTANTPERYVYLAKTFADEAVKVLK